MIYQKYTFFVKQPDLGEHEEDEKNEDEDVEEPDREPAYPYRELGNDEVRLLRILPGTGTIQCVLHQMPLSGVMCFFALSYVWGDASPKETIMLEGHPFKITRNLYEALHQFRQRPNDMGHPKDYFWIDAICINQEDVDERSRQVERMMDIYHAGLVLVWLGPVTEPDDGFINNFIRRHRLSRYSRSRDASLKVLFEKTNSMWKDWDPIDEDDNVVVQEAFGDEYGAVVGVTMWLLSHAWFSRVWTLQESCMDAVPRFFVGPHSVHSSDFYDMFDILVTQDRTLYLTPGGRRMASLKKLRDVDRALDSGSDDDMRTMELADVFWQLFKFSGRKLSTDPRDQIYGILGLLNYIKNEELPKELAPNYRLSYEQIYWDYAVFLFQSLGNLELLDCTNSELQNTPSWVPDFRHMSTARTIHRGENVRVSSDKRVLHVQGCVLGTFRDFLPGCPMAQIWPKGKSIPVELTKRLQEVEDRILKLSVKITGSTLEEGFNELIRNVTRIIPDDVDETFHQVYRRLSLPVDSKTPPWPLKRRRTMNIQNKEEAVADQFSNAFLLLHDGSIMRVNRAHVQAKPGDVICIFKGSLKPTLVRASGESYTFLGQCDVRGGPLNSQNFDDDFWADREIQDFSLI